MTTKIYNDCIYIKSKGINPDVQVYVLENAQAAGDGHMPESISEECRLFFSKLSRKSYTKVWSDGSMVWYEDEDISGPYINIRRK
tara:strand:- start:70 stop:324 length:255 start_codon:yes stop_codon:yes gene_type:complete